MDLIGLAVLLVVALIAILIDWYAAPWRPIGEGKVSRKQHVGAYVLPFTQQVGDCHLVDMRAVPEQWLISIEFRDDTLVFEVEERLHDCLKPGQRVTVWQRRGFLLRYHKDFEPWW